MDKIQTNRLNNNFQNTSQQNYFNVILQTEMTDFLTLTYTSSSQLPAVSWSLKKVPLSGWASPFI